MARKRKKPVEEEPRHAAWAIPYGDLVTLLFAFFVVLYAVSSVNEGKYRALSSTLFTEFNGQKPPGIRARVGPREPWPSMRMRPRPPRRRPIPTRSSPTPPPSPAKQAEEIARSQAESQALDKVAERYQHRDVRSDQGQSRGRAPQGHHHRGGNPHRHPVPERQRDAVTHAVGVIRKLSQTLASLPNPVRVEGHTDSQPIDTRLSVQLGAVLRAAASVVHLIANSGIDPARLSVIGRAQYSPAQSNATPSGRNANRRVLIAICRRAIPTPAPLPAQPAPPHTGRHAGRHARRTPIQAAR